MFKHCNVIGPRFQKLNRLDAAQKCRMQFQRPFCDDNNELNRVSSRSQILERLHKEGQDYVQHSARTFKYPSLFHQPTEPLRAADWKAAMNMSTSEFFRPIGSDRQRNFTDVLIIGGGAVGSSVAYALKTISRNTFKVTVLERDSQYLHASSALSVGGLQQHFTLKENIEMAAYGAEFIRNARQHLNVFESSPLDIGFQPQGHLILSDMARARQLMQNVNHSVSKGQRLTLLDKAQLRKQFNWLTVQGDIALAAFGLESEGWFDPFAFLQAVRQKAASLGADYYDGELIDFNIYDQAPTSPYQTARQGANYAVVRTPSGQVKQIQFARLVVAAGPENAEIASMLRIGEADGLRSMPVPFKKRKRYYYAFESANGPSLDFPLLIDSSGVFVRRDGFGGQYITGKCPTEEEEIDNNNSDVDYRYFENRIVPILKHRVPSFSDLKLLRGWAVFEDVNTWDQQPIIGRHPYYSNVFFAAGLGVHSVQMAPAIGRALQELVLVTDFKTIDLERFGWERVFAGNKLEDKDFGER